MSKKLSLLEKLGSLTALGIWVISFHASAANAAQPDWSAAEPLDASSTESSSTPGAILWGTGHLSVRMVTLTIDRDQAAELLPEGLVLGRPDPALGAATGKHPIIIFFGRQDNVHPVLEGVNLPKPFGPTYMEFILAVPGVRLPGSAREFAYMRKLFVNNFPAIAAGWLYGYEKEHAKIESGPNDYLVQSLILKSPIVSAWFSPGTAISQPALRAAFAPYSKFLNSPAIAVRAGKFSCSHYEWDFNSSNNNTEINPINATVSFEKAFVPGIEAGQWSTASLGQAPGGAFEMETQWRLYLPESCN